MAALLAAYINEFGGNMPGPLFLKREATPSGTGLHEHLPAHSKGIDGFQSNRSRHTGITNWVRQGVEAPMVQQLAGHSRS